MKNSQKLDMKTYAKLRLLYEKFEGVSPKHTTDSSSGIIDFEQIFKMREDIFINNPPEAILAKKKIIIRDWFLNISNDLNNELIIKKINFYHQLQQDGFQFYVFRDDGQFYEMEDIRKGLFFKFDGKAKSKRLNFLTEREIKEKAAKIGLTKDEIYIAGPINSLALIGENILTLRSSYIELLPTKLVDNLFIELSNKGSTRLNLVVDSSTAKLTDKVLGLVDNIEFPHFLMNPTLANAFLEKLTACKSVDIRDYREDQLQLPAWIEEVYISGKTFSYSSYTSLLFLIEKCSNLKTLNLNIRDAYFSSPVKEEIDFSRMLKTITVLTVEAIHLGQSEFSLDEINLLLQKSNNLKKVSINLKEEYIGLILPQSVTEADFSYSRLNFASIKQILQNCINIKRVTLTLASALLPQEKFPLMPDEEIFQSYTTKIFNFFKEYITYFPGIIPTKTVNINDIKLPQTIEEIDFSYSDIGPVVLQEVIDLLPHLKKLTLTGCKNLKQLPRNIVIPKKCIVAGLANHFPQIDSSTESKGKTLQTIELFKPKPGYDKIYTSDYRLKFYTDFDLESGIFSCVTHPADFVEVKALSITSDIVKTYKKKYEKLSDHFLGKITYPAGASHIVIPSLTPYDKLVGLESNTGRYYATYDISFCSKFNAYYLKNAYTPSGQTIYFIIKSPYYSQSSILSSFYDSFSSNKLRDLFQLDYQLSTLEFNEEGRLNSKELYGYDQEKQIRVLENYFNEFENKPLSRTCNTPKDITNAILAERAGVCRHGARTFEAVALELKLPSILVGNYIHEFVELSSYGKWKSKSFGGTSDVTIKKDEWKDEKLDDFAEPSESLLKSLTNLISASGLMGYGLMFLIIASIEIPLLMLVKYITPTTVKDKIRNFVFDRFDEIEQFFNQITNIMPNLITSAAAAMKEHFKPSESSHAKLFPSQDAMSDSSSKDNSAENYISNLNTLLIIIAASGSAALMVMVAKYFYNQAQNKNNQIKITNPNLKIISDKLDAAPEASRNLESENLNALEVADKLVEPNSLSLPSAPNTPVILASTGAPSPSSVLSPAIPVIAGPAIPKSNPFYSLESQISNAASMEEYIDEILSQAEELEKKNILCIMDEEQIESFYTTLLKKHKDSYFISNLDEISLQASLISDGEITSVDSRLTKFIKSGHGNLVTDWSGRKPQHIGFNSIIDSTRRIEKLRFDQKLVVINVLKRGIEMSEDFYPRHKLISQLPAFFSDQEYHERPASSVTSEFIEISFYHDDWQHKLYGRIKIAEMGYFYKSSELLEYINKGARNVILRNAPWSDRGFRLAIKEIEERGIIYVNGREYECQGISFSRNDIPYSLDGLIPANFNPEEEYLVVNQLSFSELFERYHIENKRPEIIETPIQRKLLVTEDLSDGQWAKLASIDAEVTVAKGVENSPFAPSVEFMSNEQTKIILTNDVGFCQQSYLDKMIVYINIETKISDLLNKITYQRDNASFEHEPSVVAKALLNGQEVILVGNPSKKLAKSLESLFINKPYMMINGEIAKFTGKLTLIAEKITGLNMITPEERLITTQEIWAELATEYSPGLIEKLKNLCDAVSAALPQFKSFSFTQIDSMLHRMELKPSSNPLKHILRLEKNYREIKPILEELWPRQVLANKPSRLEKVINEAKISPVVFVVGPSGAGKSFMRKQLKTVFELREGGMEKLKQLTEKATDKPIAYLFDEANLDSQPALYETLNGLLDPSRTVLIDGALQQVPEGNIAILAGNYGYFKDRKEIRVIQEHGSIISFKELGDEIIKYNVIQPILLKLFPDGSSFLEATTQILINAYHHINRQFPGEEPLTPRNLEMMSFRLKKLEYDGIKKPSLRAAMAVYDEVSVTMQDKTERQAFRTWLEEESALEIGSIKNTKRTLKDSMATGEFFIADSRKNSIRLLDYMIFIRELKINNEDLDAAAINAITFEGPTGISKSYTIIKFLESRGFIDASQEFEFTEALHRSDREPKPKKYYLITPTNYEKAKDILLYAFDNGEIVIIDEINTLPLEVILNPLLSGINLQGEKAKYSGFTIFATKNPISYVNRLTFSDAFNKRFQEIYLKELKEKELVELVMFMTKDQASMAWSEAIVEYYLEAITYARKNNLLLIPSLRQLDDYVEPIFRAKTPPEVKPRVAEIDGFEVNAAEQLSILDIHLDTSTVDLEQIVAADIFLREQTENALTMTASSIIISEQLTSFLNDYFKIIYVNSQSYIDRFSKNVGNALSIITNNNYLNSQLFKYAYKEELYALQAILSKPYITLTTSKAIKELLVKPIDTWTRKDFRTINLAFHPDRIANFSPDQRETISLEEVKQDYTAFSDFAAKYDSDKMSQNLYSKLMDKLDPSIKSMNFYAKEADIAIDIAKIYLKPSINHGLQLAQDSIMLANKAMPNSNFGYIVPVFTSISVAQDLSNGEYWKAGINAIHGFSHYLLNNPMLPGYGTAAYILLNGLTVVSEVYNGQYLTAATHISSVAIMCVSPTLVGSIYAVSYTSQNLYALHTLYQYQLQEQKIGFSNLILKTVNESENGSLPDPYIWNDAHRNELEATLEEVDDFIDKDLLVNNIINDISSAHSFIVTNSINVFEYSNNHPNKAENVNLSLQKQLHDKFIYLNNHQYNVLLFETISEDHCKLHSYIIDENGALIGAEYVTSSDLIMCCA